MNKPKIKKIHTNNVKLTDLKPRKDPKAGFTRSNSPPPDPARRPPG
jgi:hypothetical protein